MTYRSASFDAIAPASDRGDLVIRSGKYFEIGDYPDKEFSLTSEEADAAILAFQGAPINLEHMPTLLDGKLGSVRRLWRQGLDILAEYAIPLWLHRVTGGEPLKISSEWDRSTRMPVGAALVLSPRIHDAVMMAADEQHVPVRNRKGEPEVSLLNRLASFLRGEGLLDPLEEPLNPPDTAQPVAAPQSGAAANVISSPRGAGESPQFSSVDPVRPPVDFRSSAEYSSMSARLQEQEELISRLRDQFDRDQERATLVSHFSEIDALIRQGRMTASEGDNWQKIAREHPDAFAATLPALKARAPLTQFGDSRLKRISPNPEEPGSQIVALTRERVSRTGERFESAFSTVCRENPELAALHAAGTPRFGGAVNE